MKIAEDINCQGCKFKIDAIFAAAGFKVLLCDRCNGQIHNYTKLFDKLLQSV